MVTKKQHGVVENPYVYVVTLQCADTPGIVRAASSAIFAVGGNILENDQFTDSVTGQFCMRTRFELPLGELDSVRDQLEHELSQFKPLLGVRLENQHQRVLIMVSKLDHCLADLLYRHERGELPLDIVAVVSNHSNCAPLAARYSIPFVEIPVTAATKDASERQLRSMVESYGVDFIVLARYMQVLSPQLCADLEGRIVNIHHSFLPGFKGANPYRQAFEHGVKIIGATCHYVTSDLDEGPIIDQDVVRVSHSQAPVDLEALGRDVERVVLARAVKLIAEDRVAIVGRRTVIFSQ
jgi:formyltetrahydrofolate deformylase